MKKIKHKTLEQRAKEFDGELMLDGEYDWGEVIGKEENRSSELSGPTFVNDLKRYSEMFQEIKRLQPEETLSLVLEAKSREEHDFWELVGNYLLQCKQKQVIEKNLF